MKVRLTLVPPGGGEQDYSLSFELPAAPQPGDYISIQRAKEIGTEDFVVRRTWWHLSFPESPVVVPADQERIGSLKSLVVECEFAAGGYSSEAHKRACSTYEAKGKKPKAFDMSGY